MLLSADPGSLQLTLDSVVSLVSAGDLLLLDWVVARCQQFLTDNIHLDNVITAARLASLYRMGDLDKLALKYQDILPTKAMLTCWWCTMTPVTIFTATVLTLASGECWLIYPRGLVTSTRPSQVRHQRHLVRHYYEVTCPGQQSKVYLVGGRSRDGRSLRSVFCYDLATAAWSRLADMKEVRDIHIL